MSQPRQMQSQPSTATRASESTAANVDSPPLAPLIDHTLLAADAARADIERLCAEAREHGFASVCVSSSWVPLTRTLLDGSGVVTCAVVGFPLGAVTPAAKAYEARLAVAQGAREIDMVIHLGALVSRDYRAVLGDIAGVVEAAGDAIVKVIIEAAALGHDDKIIACCLAKAAGAAFVKTSTGFHSAGGATAADVALMRQIVGPELGVKASGGIRTADDAERMLAAGASRLGASASVAIVTGVRASSQGY